MAAESLGFSFGYKNRETSHQNFNSSAKDLVWVNKRFIPTDLRSNAPVPRTKFLYQSETNTKLPEHWRKVPDPALKSFSRHMEEDRWFPSNQGTRCEEWSTLRQSLPSKGPPQRLIEPRWGTGLPLKRPLLPKIETRFPHINSPMTR